MSQAPPEDDENDNEEQQEDEGTGDAPAPGTDPGSGGDASVVEGTALALENELEVVGGTDGMVTVAGINLPGAYQYRRQGDGYESSYLKEIESGSGADGDRYGADSGGNDNGGGQQAPNSDSGVVGAPSTGEGDGTGGEEPPETVVIEAWVSYPTMEDLRQLRQRDETFEVDTGFEVMEDMELIDVSPAIEGEKPFAANCEIEVREWREYETEDFGAGEDEDRYGVDPGGTSGDPEAREDIEESGTSQEPNEVTLDEGEERNITLEDDEQLRNARFDATAPDSDVSIGTNGDNWGIENVGIQGGNGNRPPLNVSAPAGSRGDVRNVYVDGEGATAADGGAEYDVVKINAGERRVINVDSGQTYENKIIDMTASGAAALLYAHGTNWTIRNVGFRGALSGDNRCLTCSDQGGNSSVVENVYMGDGVNSGTVGDQYAPALGIWVDPDHSGHLDFRNVYVEGALDNAFYCSAPGYNGSGGTITIDGCYAKNNAISCYRLGSTDSIVKNSVAVGGSNTHRGVWAWDPGPVYLENVHLAMEGDGTAIVAGANGNSTRLEGTNVQYDASAGLNERYGSTINLDSASGTDPQNFVPEGCPTSPEQAASGQGGSGPSTPGGGREPSAPSGSDREPIPYNGPDNAPGIWADPENHKGDIQMENVHVRRMSGGGLIADTESDEAGYLRMRNSFFMGNNGVNIQLGTTGEDRSVEYDVSEPFNDSSYLDFFHDPGVTENNTIRDVSGRDGNQLDIEVTAGTHYGTDMKHEHETAVGYQPTEVRQSFWMRFSEDWEAETDGKLAGFSGRPTQSAGAGGNPADGDEWSCRMGWADGTSVGENIDIEWYIYHMDTSGSYGEHDAWNFSATPGQWYEIEQYINLGNPGVNDGVVRAWVDGSPVYNRDDLHFRNSGGNDVSESWWNIYHGNTPTAPATVNIAFDDLRVQRGGE